MDPRVIAEDLTLYSLDHLFFWVSNLLLFFVGGSQIIFIVLHNSIISLMILFDPAITKKRGRAIM
jgi:hypothetical protein